MRVDLTKVTKAVREAETRRDLWHVLLDYYRANGIEMASYHAVYRDGTTMGIVTDGFDADWICKYIDEDLAQIDPIPALAAKLTTPFLWEDITKLTELSPAAKACLAERQAAGLNSGLAFYVFGPGMRNAYVGLGFGQNKVSLDAQLITEFQVVAQLGHSRFCAFSDDPPPDQQPLSPREIETLEWMARGKSNSVIAQLMEVSPHTVDTHVRRIYAKLNVADRTTAAIRGLGSGLVQYPSNAVP